LFAQLVSNVPPNHFRASDLSLLVQYCAAVVLNEKAHDELRREPIKDGKPSPWLVISEKMHRATVALSMRLRLSPQARLPNSK